MLAPDKGMGRGEVGSSASVICVAYGQHPATGMREDVRSNVRARPGGKKMRSAANLHASFLWKKGVPLASGPIGTVEL